jgi:hypothetical protein
LVLRINIFKKEKILLVLSRERKKKENMVEEKKASINDFEILAKLG